MNNPQNFLDSIAKKDHQNFLPGLVGANWANHRILLYLGLELTAASSEPVVEYGCGDGSTEHLRHYCLEKGRKFLTYESAREWAEKCDSVYIERWEGSTVFGGKFSVAFIDLAPGEYRSVALQLLKGHAEVIVVHDTELGGAGDYKLEPVFEGFKYRLNYNQNGGGAGATIVSDTIDVTKFSGLTLGEYKFD